MHDGDVPGSINQQQDIMCAIRRHADVQLACTHLQVPSLKGSAGSRHLLLTLMPGFIGNHRVI